MPSLGSLGYSVTTGTNRFRKMLDQQEPDLMLASTLSDSEIFEGRCFAPLFRILGPMAVIPRAFTWLGMIMLIMSLPIIREFAPLFAQAVEPFGGPVGYFLILALTVVIGYSLMLFVITTAAAYACTTHPLLAAIGSVLDIGICVLVIRYIALSIITSFDPRYRDLFYIMDFQSGSGFFHTAYLFIIALLLVPLTLLSVRMGNMAFKKARQGGRTL